MLWCGVALIIGSCCLARVAPDNTWINFAVHLLFWGGWIVAGTGLLIYFIGQGDGA